MPSGVYKHKTGYKRPPFSKEWRDKIGLSHIGKNTGDANPAKRDDVRKKISVALIGNKNSAGRTISEEHRKAIGESNRGEKNRQWKGDAVSYRELHKWVRKYKLLPLVCSLCNSQKKLDWANVDGMYRRNLDDFIALCRECHKKYDQDRGTGRSGSWGS